MIGIVGTTGSGKTSLVTVMVEEALRAKVPTLVIDVKGDLPNLLLSFPRFDPADFAPWVEAAASDDDEPIEQVAAALNELRSTRWDTDPESARAALSAAVSLVLRLLGRDPDPAKSREHVLLSVLAEQRLSRGEPAPLAALLTDLQKPPIEDIGALSVDAFLPKSERKSLAAALNTLLASPSFASWRERATLNIAEWMKPKQGRTPAVVVSVATALGNVALAWAYDAERDPSSARNARGTSTTEGAEADTAHRGGGAVEGGGHGIRRDPCRP